jgi:rubrerythrin
MLVAIGLPACWTAQSSPPPKPAEPPPQAYVPPPKPEPEIAMFDVKSCGVDTIVESVCGRGSGEYCSATAKGVELSPSNDGLYVTMFDAAVTSANEFILDDQKSEVFVTRLQTLNEKLDGKPGCCYSRCTELVIGVGKPLPPTTASYLRGETCIPRPPKGTTQPDANNAECPQGVEIVGELRPFSSARNEMCCYTVLQRRSTVIRGRPARVAGEMRFAPLQAGTAWHGDVKTERRDARLAAKWLEDARMEHASVAAFSATALRLMALGAPPELIAATHRAALEEIEHARAAFALAASYGGEAVTPGPLAIDARPMTLRELAIETFVDGCVGETTAAYEAACEAEVEPDPEVRAVLAKISEDEARHAELAWQIAAWCVAQDRSIVNELYVENAREDVMREVVAPCVAALAA